MSRVWATGFVVAALCVWLGGCVRPPADHPAFEEPTVSSSPNEGEPASGDNAVGDDGAFALRDIPPAANAAPETGNEELPTDTDITDFAEEAPAEAGGVTAAPGEAGTSGAVAAPPLAATVEGQKTSSGGATTAGAQRPRAQRPVVRPRPRHRRSHAPAKAVKARPRPAAPKGNDDLERKARDIKARRGKQFSDPEWQREYRDKAWYQANPDYSDAHLSPTERENLKRIRRQQTERGEKAAR